MNKNYNINKIIKTITVSDDAKITLLHSKDNIKCINV